MTNRYDTQWDVERETRLRQFAAQKISQAVIADRMGTTLGAVAQKLSRLGISTARANGWNDERVAKLKALLVDPRTLSAADMARELGGGLERCAVIGKVRRLGLQLPNANGSPRVRSDDARRPRKPRNGAVARPREPKPFLARSSPAEIARRKEAAAERRVQLACTEIVDLTPEQSATAVAFGNLNETTCRWPVSGDARDLDTMKFCGAAPAIDRPYCPHHWRIAHKRGDE